MQSINGRNQVHKYAETLVFSTVYTLFKEKDKIVNVVFLSSEQSNVLYSLAIVTLYEQVESCRYNPVPL